MNVGKIFEQEIKESIESDIYYHRIKDPAQSFGGTATRFSLHNEFDAYMYKYPVLVAMELKSNQGTSISFSLDDNKHNIKKCQIESLKDCVKHNGMKAGLLLNFRKTNVTYWITIQDFLHFVKSTDKKSINEKDIINNHGLIIPQKLKKVKYRYFLNEIFEYENIYEVE